MCTIYNLFRLYEFSSSAISLLAVCRQNWITKASCWYGTLDLLVQSGPWMMQRQTYPWCMRWNKLLDFHALETWGKSKAGEKNIEKGRNEESICIDERQRTQNRFSSYVMRVEMTAKLSCFEITSLLRILRQRGIKRYIMPS